MDAAQGLSELRCRQEVWQQGEPLNGRLHPDSVNSTAAERQIICRQEACSSMHSPKERQCIPSGLKVKRTGVPAGCQTAL